MEVEFFQNVLQELAHQQIDHNHEIKKISGSKTIISFYSDSG
jgi:hypothetical protein